VYAVWVVFCVMLAAGLFRRLVVVGVAVLWCSIFGVLRGDGDGDDGGDGGVDGDGGDGGDGDGDGDGDGGSGGDGGDGDGDARQPRSVEAGC